jgi:NAD(P)-dependent dehydrogenase (short-subunit alcohol dehydrogenase family)
MAAWKLGRAPTHDSTAVWERIVNISSIICEMDDIGQANYATSKSGLFGLTKTLALEEALELKRVGALEEDGIGINVNTVAPVDVITLTLAASEYPIPARHPRRFLGLHPIENRMALRALASQ